MNRFFYLFVFLFFIATTTQAQTIVKNINPGSADSYPYPMAGLGTNMIFYGNDATKGYEVWISDGTTAGTKMLLDLFPGASGSLINYGSMVLNGKFYFGANDGSNGYELWSTDGTTAGTTMVKNINAGAANGFFATQMVVFNNKLYFAANDGTSGSELWESDGSTANTTIVKNINAGINSSNPANFTVALGKLFFTADDGTSGTELWKTDGTTANTVKVGDIGAGALGGNPGLGVEFNGFIYFAATGNISDGNELWRSDGTTLELVKNINPTASAGSNPGNFVVVGSKLYFTANDGTTGTELWVTDGTTPGTVIVKNINPIASAGSNPFPIGMLNSKLLLSANDGTTGTELWSSDGTAAGTTMIMDVNTGAGSGFTMPASYNYSNARYIPFTNIVNNIFYFAGNDGTNGVELWKTDGTAGGTSMLPQMNPSTGSSAISWLFITNNKQVWMSATDGSSGQELFKYDIPSIGINGNTSNKSFNVYPNPAADRINFSSVGSAVIYDMFGKEVETFENKGGFHNISSLPAGMYTINVSNEGKLLSTRFIKN